MRLEATEQDILNSIIQVLLLKGVLAVHVRTTGVIINRDGKTFFGKSRFNEHQRGAADIIFAYKGVPVACEVKTKTGRVRPDQAQWLERWTKKPNYGYSFIARSVDDVLQHLKTLDAREPRSTDSN